MDKPLRIIGEQIPNLWGKPRRSVVLQSRQSMVVLCNARCALLWRTYHNTSCCWRLLMCSAASQVQALQCQADIRMVICICVSCSPAGHAWSRSPSGLWLAQTTAASSPSAQTAATSAWKSATWQATAAC